MFVEGIQPLKTNHILRKYPESSGTDEERRAKKVNGILTASVSRVMLPP